MPKYLVISWHPPPVPNDQRASSSTYPQKGAAAKKQRRSPCPLYPPIPHPQEPAAPKVKQRAPSPPLPPPPPPDFLPILQSKNVCSASVACDPFPPPSPSPLLPVLEKSGDGPLPLEGTRRGVGLRKVEKQSCELDMNTAWKTLMKQIKQGVKLKPVSSHVLTKRSNHSC